MNNVFLLNRVLICCIVDFIDILITKTNIDTKVITERYFGGAAKHNETSICLY